MTTSGSNDYATFRRALRRAAPGLQRPLPWIRHPDPWAILVSEIMLQQTQTSRVVEPWTLFLQRFPTPGECADAPLSSVLTLWGGLGFPRRAKALHTTARMIRDDFDGVVPSDVRSLRSLAGVGEYTANAIASFAFGQRVAVLDTNVGRIVSRAITNRSLSAREARDVTQALLPRSDVAAFNQALLDLGAQYCRSSPLCATCPVRRSCAWRRLGGADPAPTSAGVSRPQGAFVGSNRQIRGRVLAVLREGPASRTKLELSLPDVEADRRELIVQGLIEDGLVEGTHRGIRLAR
ncbi:MAG: HhH-GPD family protein [Acidimicrobiales bacterium]